MRRFTSLLFTHTHTLSLSLSLFLAWVSAGLFVMIPSALADDATREVPPDVPRSLEEISLSTSIVPDTLEFELLPPETKALILDRPGAAAAVLDGRVAAIYGVPLAEGASAGEAEAAFWSRNGAAFGLPNLDLISVRSQNLNNGRFTVFSYQQRITGLPVEYSRGRLVVRNGESSQVVMVSGRFVEPPIGGLAPVLVTPDEASVATLSQPAYSRSTIAGQPQLVVFAGADEDWADRSRPPAEPIICWKLVTLEERAFVAHSVFVNATNAHIAHVRNDVFNFDVTGTVQGYATPWLPPNNAFPDIPGHAPELMAIPGIKVSIDGGGFAYTEADGSFFISHNGPNPVTVRATVTDGQWANVFNLDDNDPNTPALPPEISIAQTGNQSDPYSLVLNAPPPPPDPMLEWGTAQLNALIHTYNARKFIVDRSSSWNGLNSELRIDVNAPPSCDAFFYGTGAHFKRRAFSCNNANFAFSSIITHEYGHFLQNQLGLVQPSFGEGFGDAFAILVLDDPVVGRNVNFQPGYLRSYATGAPDSLKTYPCPAGGQEAYECGKVLAGFWRDVLVRCRANIGSNPGQFPNDAAALEYVRQIFVDWDFVTVGAAGRHAAHPLTAQEVLVVSDDDCNLGNGTPHSAEICTAALAHGLVGSKFLYQLPGPGNPYCSKPPAGTNEIISFHPPQATYSSEGGLNGIDPFGIAVGNLDPRSPSDPGPSDVVLVCEGSTSISGSAQIQVYLAQSSSSDSYTFDPPAVIVLPDGSKPAKVALADVAIPNHPADGTLDIVVTLPELNAVRIYRNQGNGTFSSNASEWLQLSTVQRPIGVAVADWDGTNGNDIAVAGYVNDASGDHPAIGFLWAQGGGSYNPASIALTQPGRGYDLHGWTQEIGGLTVHRLAITNEVLSVGLEEYVTVYDHSGGQSFTLRQALRTFHPSRAVTTSPVTVGDTLPDVVCTSYDPNTNRIWWFRANADGSFQVSSNSPDNFANALELNPLGIAAGKLGKLDNSGLDPEPKVDLVVATPVPPDPTESYSRLRLYRNTGNPIPEIKLFRLADSHLVPVDFDVNKSSYSRQVVVVDLNGDGLVDIVSSNRGLVGDDDAEGFTVLLNRDFGG